jgi:hypothetical protein
MSTGGQGRIRLWHGTTRRRAEAILKNGPDRNFLEPGSFEKANGFSTALPGTRDIVGTPERYAQGKARLFPDEGGPAVLEIEVPEDIVRLAINVGGEFRFAPGDGFEELLLAWPTIPKRIL